MPSPATTGSLRTKVKEMLIGDYIVCKYVAASGVVGVFSELGASVATEIPVIGEVAPNGTFYFVKAAKGLLIADRVVQHRISWDILNTGKYIQGKPQTFGEVSGAIRSLTGGVSYADANGKSSAAATSYGGWPTNNEWDKYIIKFPIDRIQTGKNLEDVFHRVGVYTWTQDTPIKGVASSRDRTSRSNSLYYYNSAAYINLVVGFRPVFYYKEGV